MLRSLLIAAVLVSTLGVSACNTGNKEQQPTADEQKRIQEETEKAIEQQKQLTSGYGQFHEPCRAQYRRINAPDKAKKQQAPHQSQRRQQQQQPSNQPQQ